MQARHWLHAAGFLAEIKSVLPSIRLGYISHECASLPTTNIVGINHLLLVFG